MLYLHQWQRLLGLKYARVLRRVVKKKLRKKSFRPSNHWNLLLCYILCVFMLLSTLSYVVRITAHARGVEGGA